MAPPKKGRPPGKYTQSERVDRLLNMLRANHFGLAMAELASTLGVSTKTLQRDRDVLAERGHETYLDGEGVGRRLRLREDELGLTTVVLDQSERFALLALREVFEVLRDTPLREGVASLLDKVEGGLSKDARARVAQNRARFVYLPEGGPKRYEGKQEVLDGLWDGVLRSRRLRYRYEREGKATRKGMFEAYAMVLYKQGLYVVGRDIDCDTSPRVFAVERFTKAEPQKSEGFEVPKGFDAKQFFDGAFGIFQGAERIEVVIDFRQHTRELLSSRAWHTTQTIESLPSGDLRFRMQVSHLGQVLPWLLSWGADARPVAPAALVSAYADAVKEMAARAEPSTPTLHKTKPERDATRRQPRDSQAATAGRRPVPS
jgi:proteasome accessory factor B